MWQLIIFAVLSLLSWPASAAQIEDASGRIVTVPDHVERVMAAGPPAAVVLYVLAPEKMIGWPVAPRPNEREFLLPAVRNLPELGRLTGRGDTANIEVVLQAKPDVIFDFGSVTATFASLAARVQDQTGVPYLLFDGRLDRAADSVRVLGTALGVKERADLIARYIEETEELVDERLMDLPPAARHRVYLAREANGLETGLTGSSALRGGIANVSMEQVIAWAPDTIVTWDATFFVGYAANPLWATVPAVAAKRVYLAPRLPFGWIDAPPAINRYIGLRWIARLLYPDRFPEDIHTTAREFFKLFYQIEPDDAALDRVLAGAQPGGRGR
jgi:iron complex transport system substrate-binding protein